MRQVYAHQAIIVPVTENDPVMVIDGVLAGAAHRVLTSADGDRSFVRILFAVEPHRVEGLRERLDAAMAGGAWTLVESGCTRVTTEERPAARALLAARPDCL
ncbi:MULTISPECIES: hypothetical protein [Actinoplanes]|uniref:hypothetical protein n=1 Tax=Actinoplanes TaxID=1865 RepID=UPI0005F2AEA6|nr:MULTISPECIES: hypothetical protein [Actinoplanes]GLY07538.1 hypothetical protein Acsp01_79170 [Actinoplanes sp. NBRC 101535]